MSRTSPSIATVPATGDASVASIRTCRTLQHDACCCSSTASSSHATHRCSSSVNWLFLSLTIVMLNLSLVAAAPSCTTHLLLGETVSRCYEFSYVPASQELAIETTMLYIDGQNLAVLPASADSQVELRSLPDPGLVRLKRLKFLDLSSNQLSNIYPEAFSGNSQLLNLSLDNNFLVYVPPGIFRTLNKLQHLNLARNAISVISSESFDFLTGLLHLNLSSNQISRFEPGVFAHLRNLRELFLSNNHLTTLSEALNLELPPTLSILHLGRNRFHCDCSLLWLKIILTPNELRGSLTYDKDELSCYSSPVPEAIGQKWVHLRFSQFACAPNLLEPEGELQILTYSVGESATLTCRIASSPKNEIFWKRGTSDLSIIDGKYSISHSPSNNFSANLTINNVQMSDAGTYSCVTRNDAGSAIGNFSIRVQNTPAIDHDNSNDNMERGMWAAARDKSGLVNYLTVIGASVCAFLFIVTIISTIFYCLATAKAAKRRKSRRAKSKLTKVSANGSLGNGPDKQDGVRTQLPPQTKQYEPLSNDAVDPPNCFDGNGTMDSPVGQVDSSMGNHNRGRSTMPRQVTFAETCPIHGCSTSVAVVQPLVNGSLLPDHSASPAATPTPSPTSASAMTNAALCPVHGAMVGAFGTLPNGVQVYGLDYDNGYSGSHSVSDSNNNSGSGGSFGSNQQATGTIQRMNIEVAPGVSNLPPYFGSLKPATATPTRQFSFQEQYGLQTINDLQLAARFGTDRQYNLLNNYTRCCDDEGYNTAV